MCTGETSDNTVSIGCIPFYKPFISLFNFERNPTIYPYSNSEIGRIMRNR